MSEKPSEADILSLVEKLENTLDDGSLEHLGVSSHLGLIVV